MNVFILVSLLTLFLMEKKCSYHQTLNEDSINKLNLVCSFKVKVLKVEIT